MNVLEKILEEIEERRGSYSRYSKSKIGKKSEKEILERITELGYVEEIIRSHMGEMENDGWIPVEDKQVPEKEVIAQNVYDEMMIGYVYYSEEMGWYECVSDDVYLTNVVAWQPRPKSYKKHRQ
nr:MAG TPA: Protein of unknown function (DUF551) [Caudoviricetes sp.]